MDEETNTLIAKWYMARSNYGTVAAREFPDWAISQLEQGRDSKYLRILASSVDAQLLSDVDGYFRQSLKELGWDFPYVEFSIDRYSRSVMQQIVTGVIKPYDGCKQLYDMCMFLDYPKNLYNWNALYWGEEEINEEELDKIIVEEARRTLAGEKSDVIHEGCFTYRPPEKIGFWAKLRGKLS